MPDASQEKLSSKSEPPINSLLRPARRVLFIVGAIVGIIELVQHFILNDFEINLYLIGEVAIYFLALPAVGWILFGLFGTQRENGGPIGPDLAAANRAQPDAGQRLGME